jgi:VWFA-related protein
VVVLLLLLAMAGAARGDAPLTTADLVRFLRAGISERTILSELGDRGFAEPLDQVREATLREAGASASLVEAVRRTGPPEVVAAPPPPARSSATPPPARKSDVHGPTFSAATQTVRVPVSVLDKSGRPLTGLRGADFRISEEGKRQEVTLFSGERQPLRLALALDVSGSMQNKIRQVERALRYFIDLLEPADQIMVITFNDEVRVVQGFTSDRALLGRVLDALQPVGGTALFDAAYEAIQRVGRNPAESKAVVLVSDGVDTTSVTTFQALRELARRTEVPVFSIGLEGGGLLRNFTSPPRRPGPPGGWPGGGGRGRPPVGGPGRLPGGPGGWPGGGGSGGGPPGRGRADFDAGPLLELADETGGRAEILSGFERYEHYSPDSDSPSGGRLQSAVESIAMTLRFRYLIGYEPPQGKHGWRRIDVEVDQPSAVARARKGYYAGG